MRYETGAHKLIHVSRHCTQFHVRHIRRQFISFLLCLRGQQHNISSAQRRISNIVEFIQRYIRKHTNINSILHIDSATNATGHIHMINHRHIKIQGTKHRADCWENCSLCTDKIVNIYFRNLYILHGTCLFFKGNHIASHSILIVANAFSFSYKFSFRVYDATHIELTDDINNPWTTQTNRLRSWFSYNLVSGLHGLFVDSTSLNCSICCPHSTANISTLKCRACWTGTTHHKVRVSKYKLSIRSQIYKKWKLGFIPNHTDQSTGSDISAHITSDIRRYDYMCIRVNRNPHIWSKQWICLEKCWYVWFHAQRIRVNARKQMIHRTISCYTHTINGVSGYTCLFAHFLNHRIDCIVDNCPLESIRAAWLLLLDDTIDNISPIANLSVSSRCLSQNLSIFHIDNQRWNCRGTNINRQTTD